MPIKKARRNSKVDELRTLVNSTLKLGDEGREVLLGSDEYFRIERIPTGSLVLDRITGGGFALGRHYELYGDECVTPETKVWKADGTWDEAGNISEGDYLIGFDEFPVGSRGVTRMLRQAEVISNKVIKRPCVRIVTDRGSETVFSDSHPLLRINGAGKPVWRKAGELLVGDRISWFGSPYGEPLNTWESGYLAGLFDGEGWLEENGRIAFAQRDNEVLERGKRVIESLGFKTTVRLANGNRQEGWQPVYAVYINGGLYETMRFLQLVQPERFKGELEFMWNNRSVAKKGRDVESGSGYATIEEIESVGVKEVCAASTTTQTLVTDGILSHNSSGKSYIVYRTMALSQARGNVCAVIDPEHSFDFERFEFLGGRSDDLLAYHPNTAEQAVSVMMLLANHAKAHDLEVVGIDSVASLVAREELEKDPREEDRIGSQARMMSRALRRITTVNEKVLFLWTNQERTNIGIRFGNPNTTSGGKALRFYATGRIEFRKGGKVRAKRPVARAGKLVESEVTVGRWTQVRVEKDKSTIPGREGTFVFNYDLKMIDPAWEVIQLGLEDGLIQRSSNGWYSYTDLEDIEYKGTEKKFRKILMDNEELREEIEAVIRDNTVNQLGGEQENDGEED